ncbi:MAG: Uma2 family endonuclease [Microcystis sp. M54BS1]|jgi:Uma2 family endonuclease|nr:MULTISPECIES: Uma2 family endonuclease [unclassified Microcystis]MBE5230630.1 Uma2 family endonuclease [Microcystis aeruginosa PMC 728.11]MCA2541974.1 Uma2 family endonuclease [Microcystis sp. M54BS1]MCA2596844.1 Uma2 family endonuclease [Microcystis sp. M38BS1]MCA2611099.1 Uma2 family endonuclease [Microcystis sp. M27BS1]NCS29989.1 Uma2 family endonuclease [Microcystis aeruginosa F13-15]
MTFIPAIDPDIEYPDSDGKPMADNTEQYEWIVKIKENIEILFADSPLVFIAGDLLWYPVQDKKITGPVAPDVMVVFGRPKGRRGSYKQWEEDNIAPQVVFEILSPSNSLEEMERKLLFYQRYGVEEYYLYDPDTNNLKGWLRQEEILSSIPQINRWVSPRLKIQFELTETELEIYSLDGQKFLTFIELSQKAEQASSQLEQERLKAEQASSQLEQERLKAEQASLQLEQECLKAERLAEYIRSLGIDPDTL